MKRRTLELLSVCLLVTILTPMVAMAHPVGASGQAGGVQVFEVSQQDLNGDGVPDLTIINCDIATPYDRVLVFDGGKDMRRSSTWEGATDFTNDTWVFDIGGNGGTSQAALIIAFTTDGGDTLARIYDGSVTGGVVHYDVAGTNVHVSSPQYPSMIIRAKGNWLNSDGTLNYNLIWQYDGPAANRDMAKQYPSVFSLDGSPKLEGEVSDPDHDGIPDYLWSTLLASVPSSERIPRSGIQVNSGQHRPSALTNVVFWPLLNQPDDPKGKNYFDTPVFLPVDWKAGLIGSFTFQGYPVEDGYHVNTLNTLKRGVINVLPFENEMAYYDLADDHDGRPELFIRFAYTPPGDPYFATGGPTRWPIEMVQYSWNQKNYDALRWDFKVDLAGRNPINRTVTLGDLLLQQIPHDELPRWVVSHPWAFATFVAYESGDGYLSSEGIYDWSTLEGVQQYGGIYSGSPVGGSNNYTGSNINSIPDSTQIQRDFLDGASSKSPADLYQSILVGFRGEYADVNGPVRLYFSPIDARLHLLGASRGVYNIGNRQRVEYRNLEDGHYLDSWQLYDGGQLASQLFQSRDYLTYSQDDHVTLLQAQTPAEIFDTKPPTNNAEWLKLGQELAANKRDFAPGDLEAMLGQFAGPKMEISNASIEDYRPLGGSGFRFVLDLRPNFRSDGNNLLDLSGLQPGQYAVTYNGHFSIEPLSPPSLSVSVAKATLLQLEPSALPVTLRNDGLQDVPQAKLELWAQPAHGPAMLVATRQVALLAQTPLTTTIQWAPPTAGTWSISAVITQPDGQRFTFNPSTVTVSPALAVSPETLLSSTILPLALPFVFVALVSFAAIAAWAVGQQWKTPVDGSDN